MKIFAVMRAASLVVLVVMLSGCAGVFGPPEPPAPIEDRVQKKVVSAPLNTAAKTIPLPEQTRFKSQPLITHAAAPTAGNAHVVPAPQLALTDKTPQHAMPELSFPAAALPAEDENAALPAEGERGAVSAAPPAFSPAVQSLVTAANTATAQHNWDRAQAALERAVKLAPSKSSLWQQLAYTQLQSGNLERAREVAQRALSLAAADGREDVAAWRLFGDIEQARGDVSAAQLARANAARLTR